MTDPAAATAGACPDCVTDVDHCHGTGIVHVDGSCTCSDDPDCLLAAELHAFTIACGEAECGCDDPSTR